MQCPACRAENPSGARFCEQCGVGMEARCTQCGASVRPGARFCVGCGQPLETSTAPPSETASNPQPRAMQTVDLAAAAQAFQVPSHLAEKIRTERPAKEGERRQVTVLFGDIAGFTAMTEKLDPEDVHEIVRRGFELITTEIYRFEGSINQYGGDGLMALFGAPIAHEDAPRRAVHAALGIQRVLRDYAATLERERGLKLQMRVGINTGTVVVGRIGTDLHMEYTAIGDTINLASRLQSLARPGSVLISDSTHKSVSDFFETLEVGELEIKGHAPVRAFEVLRPHGRRARRDLAVERALTPLVGRDRPLATFGDLFTEVKAGHGKVVFVSGEAGIGKSRLLIEFRRLLAAASEEFSWLEGRCVSFGASSPMLPILDQLRENFRIDENDGEPEIIAKIEHGMRRLGGLDSEVPYIRYLLAVDPGDQAVLAMDAAARRTRIFNGLRALALRGAGMRPLVLIFEDMHWADSSTLEYLDFLMDSVAGARLMLILTHRLEYAPRFGTKGSHDTINLRHLTDEQTLEMASRFLGSELFPEELRSALMQKAEGVPLFVEEVTKTLLDLGYITRENGRYKMAKALDDLAIPGTIQGIIMARLDRLGDDGKRTVQLASVIGRQFLVRLLERVAGLTVKLEGLLRELKALEIIYELGMIPEPAYVFKHAVIQDVAYNSLLMRRRKELHGAVGEAIEELFRDRLAEHYAELAYHFSRGEDWSRVMQYSKLAGDQCSHSFANAEAIQHYTQAIDAAAKVPLTASGAIGDLHASRGGILSVIGRHQEAIDDYALALDCARSVNDRARECRFLLGLSLAQFNAHQIEAMLETSQRSGALAEELGEVAIQASGTIASALAKGICDGATPEIIEQAEEAVRLAETLTDRRLLAQTTVTLGQLLQWHEEFTPALDHLHKGLELARESHSGFAFGQSLFSLGNLSLSRGEYEQALGWYQQLNEYSQAAGDAFWLARVPNCVGAVSLELYDLERALELQIEGDEAARKYSAWPEPRGHSLLKAGLVHLERTDYGRAEEFFLRAWALLELDDVSRYRWHIPLLYARGALELACGRHDEAVKFATESLELARKTSSRKHQARAQRLQGEILAATGRLDEAAPLLEASVVFAQTLKTPREIWMGALALGNALLRLGRDKEAEVAFSTAAGTIESIATALQTDVLISGFLAAPPVIEVFKVLGRRPPMIDPPCASTSVKSS
jgi:class 3 adenylate cyclase/tetratricopeptide (TPR) repeat protein